MRTIELLKRYEGALAFNEVVSLVRERELQLKRPHWEKVWELLRALPTGAELQQRNGALHIDLDSAVVKIGWDGDLSKDEHAKLDAVIRALIPWRKGPFELFGHFIDSEWRSDFKWSRIAPHLPPLSGRRIADIGCSNGYYMFRMLAEAERAGASPPECIVGLDPSEAFYFSFKLFQKFLERPELTYLLLGVEQITYFPEFFDVIFCLGVVYHQRDPLTMLQNIRASLSPGGTAIIESQAISGDEPVALFAPDRYAKARNTYFIPTTACLLAWMQRAGFSEISVVSESVLTPEEQRRTELAPYESLEDYLDPADRSRTLEGFPAPRRVCVIGRK